ncbi:hypothetical protein [Inediibacterium massiliense]|uniref:hypothetical protein n=1 Tax=Inediibacterium massiliense TaxID=1658111 RepID=UPI0006B5841F|nr:hypothetical protein [Inediibacterium massiliense]
MDYLQEFKEKCKDIHDYIRLMKEDIHFKDSIDSIESFVYGIIQEVEEVLMDEELNENEKMYRLNSIVDCLKDMEDKYFSDGYFNKFCFFPNKLRKAIKYIIQKVSLSKDEQKRREQNKEIRIPTLLFHGTSVNNAKNIMEEGKIISSRDNVEDFDYKKIFVTAYFFTACWYAKLGDTGAKLFNPMYKDTFCKTDNNEEGIIFALNLFKYNTYTFIPFYEYFVFDNIDADAIEHIYHRKQNGMIQEITKEELMRL